MKQFLLKTIEFLKPKTGQRRRRGVVLALCILSASVFWFSTNLNKKYRTTISYPLKIVKIPKEIQLTGKLRSSIEVQVEGMGTDLFFEDVQLKKDTIFLKYNNSYRRGYILTKNHLEDVQARIKSGIKVVRLRPDSIYFQHAKRVSKRVPLISQVKVKLEPTYQLERPPKLEPDSIDLIGPQTILTNIEEWYTMPISIGPVTGAIAASIPIDTSNHIITRRKKAKLYVSPERYTQMAFKMPVHITEKPKNLRIKLNSDSLTIACLVPMSAYDSIQNHSFSLNIPFYSLDRSYPHIAPDFGFLPHSIKVLHSSPHELSYTLIRETQ